MNESETTLTNSDNQVNPQLRNSNRARRHELIGKVFGYWTVLAEAAPTIIPATPEEQRKWNRKRWVKRNSLVRCVCGNEKIVSNRDLIHGETKSCGCLKPAMLREAKIKHGMSRSPIYGVWCGIIDRCTNPNADRFKDYGGRGITICERWRNSFEAFLEDMGPGKEGWEIDRVNNNGNYEITNCVYATPIRQARNKRSNWIVTVRGVTACVAELCEKFNVPYPRTCFRLRKGWSPEEAFFSPPMMHIRRSRKWFKANQEQHSHP